MAALGVVIMLSGNLIPVLTYVAPMLASLTLIPILSEFGKKYAWMTWGVTALLALLLCADREAAFFYLFIGWYPILKPTLDRIASRAMRILAKLLLFTLVFVLLFVLLTFVMGLEDMKSEMLLSIVVYAMLVVTMLLSFLLGLFVMVVYRLTYSGPSFSKSFALSLVMLSMVTALAILTVRSNVVLSLGMVGALSIVRFRCSCSGASWQASSPARATSP